MKPSDRVPRTGRVPTSKSSATPSSDPKPKGTSSKAPAPVDESKPARPRATVHIAANPTLPSSKSPSGSNTPRRTTTSPRPPRLTTQQATVHPRTTIQSTSRFRQTEASHPPPFTPAPPTPPNLVKYSQHAKAFIPLPTDPLVIAEQQQQGVPELVPQTYTLHLTTRSTITDHEGGGDVHGQGPPKLRNAFTCTERAVQTLNMPMKDRIVETEQRPLINESGQCSVQEIYDSYMASGLVSATDEAASQAGSSSGNSIDTSTSGNSSSSRDGVVSGVVATKRTNVDKAAKVLQRLAFHNLHSDIAMDFKYWEDPADAARPNEGTLLPLWTFSPPGTSTCGRAVTALAWNPRYWDLFAAGYGGFEPGRFVPGLVCCHSIRDPSHPEWQLETPSGVLSLDFHPTAPHLLAVGCQDGTVIVANIAKPSSTTTPKTSSKSTKRHTDGVWDVKWLTGSHTPGQKLQLYSAGADGKILLWEVKEASLQGKELFEFQSDSKGKDMLTTLVAGCSCIDTHPSRPSEMLVGTQNGRVYRCSTDYSSAHAEIYEDPATLHQPLYTVRWNPHLPTTFFTASSAGTLNIWSSTPTPLSFSSSLSQGRTTAHNNNSHAHHTQQQQQNMHTEPLIVLDAESSIGDAAWAPYSSTVLAAATASGRVVVYDLEKSRDVPLCSQKVVRKAGLTKIRFNPKHPIVIVGHDRGEVLCFKLSPNLRRDPSSTNTNNSNTNSTTNTSTTTRPAGAVSRRGGGGQKKAAYTPPSQSERLQSALNLASELSKPQWQYGVLHDQTNN